MATKQQFSPSGILSHCRGVNFGADNWLVFKKVTIEQVIASQKKSSIFSSSTFKDSSSSSEVRTVCSIRVKCFSLSELSKVNLLPSKSPEDILTLQ